MSDASLRNLVSVIATTGILAIDAGIIHLMYEGTDLGQGGTLIAWTFLGLSLPLIYSSWAKY